MATSPPLSSPASPEFQDVFRAYADPSGRMTFERFMELALYHPHVGYYRRGRKRIGYAPGTDFFTSTTSGPVFGEVVAAACAHVLRSADRDPREHVFVEIGAEPERSVLTGVQHPFAHAKTIRLGEPLELSGPSIVFSNELLDAQPCVRSVFHRGEWREIGVELREGKLLEVELDSAPRHIPAAASEGHYFDQPLAAAALTASIAAASWRGLFVAIDYGKTLRELLAETPAGTVRGYFNHVQTNALLERAGEQDLTCHICWDWIADALRTHGFAQPSLDFQETFLIRNAGDVIAAATQQDAARFSPRKLALMQLLHPSHLGQKFQVMHALR